MSFWNSGGSPHPIPRDWELPQPDASESKILGHLRTSLEQGQQYLEAQPCWKDVQQFVEIMGGMRRPIEKPSSDKLSSVDYNKSKRIVRELVAGLCNIRPIANYKTENDDFKHQAEILNKRYIAWWHMTFADRSLREAVQWGAGGKGWLSPLWNANYWTHGKGEIELYSYGPNDVIPIQIGHDNNIQNAYMVTVCVETPLFQALLKYPNFADRIKPDRTVARWLRKGIRAMQRFNSPALNAIDREKNKGRSDQPTVDIYFTYVLDPTINDTGKTIPMGRPGSSWYYEVPSIGDRIPLGYQDRATGQQAFRDARAEDCRIYPLRRLIAWTEDCILNPAREEQTNTFWHGQVPLIPFQMDDWPWMFWGFPVTADTLPLERSLVNTLRAIDDTANVALNPPMKYGGTVDKSTMDRFDARIPNQSIKFDGMKSDSYLEPILPKEFYTVGEWMLKHAEWLNNAMEYLSAVKDVSALVKARQLPSADSVEKLNELMGPIVTDMGRNMERSIRDLGEQMKSNFFQFDSLARRLQVLGANGYDEFDWDYDPATLVPSHLPGEAGYEMWKANATRQKYEGSTNVPASRMDALERARWHSQNFNFHVTPNSLLQMTQLTRKMLILQLARTGVLPIDWWTIADQFDVGNMGGVPTSGDPMLEILQGPDSIIRRKLVQTELEIEIKKALGGDGSPVGPRGGQKVTGGRAPSGNSPPQLKNRPNGSSTIQESR